MRLTINADKSGDRNPDGSWPIASVVVDGNAPAEHGFADTFVARALAAGYLSVENMQVVSTEVDGVAYDRNPVITGDAIVLDVEGGPLRYRIVRHPGRYQLADGSHEVIHEYETVLDQPKPAKRG